jgi:hypothetical protein
MRYILASWDSEGFECLQDITHWHPDQFEKGQLIDILSGKEASKNPLGQQIGMMLMRARFNTHRTPEIYMFTTLDDLDFKAVEEWMNTDPQSLVNWVRKNHAVKIHSDYNPTKRRAIV